MRRYFAWIERGRWWGNELLTTSQIQILLSTFGYKHQVFASVQTYGDDDRILACPFYADFDHKDASLGETQEDVKKFVFRILSELSVVPLIYFSGNKGFHVLVPIPIAGKDCHFVVREMARELGGDLKSLDQAVYRPRAMFRLPGSPASKEGFYKTQLTRDELFNCSSEEIQLLARNRTQRQIFECDTSKTSQSAWDELVALAEARLPVKRPRGDLTLGYQSVTTPCILTFLEDGVHTGERNRALFVLAKHFKSLGYTMEEAVEELREHEHWKLWDDTREAPILPVLRSVFRSKQPVKIGCRTGLDGEIMREHCSLFCPFNEKFPDLRVKGTHALPPTKGSPV